MNKSCYISILYDVEKGALHHFPNERGSFASSTPSKMNGVGHQRTHMQARPPPKDSREAGVTGRSVGRWAMAKERLAGDKF